MMSNIPVPVLMCHSVGISNSKWQFNYLTCPYEIFENQLKWLKKNNYNSISLQQLYAYMKQNSKLPKKPIIISFDEGYLDNWVFAYPLLKKYGFKGTIYVNPEFIDGRWIKRRNLADVWAEGEDIARLDTIGYVSWKELKIMEEDGTIDVQSHTMTHTWYPKSNQIIDFRHPLDPYIWMTWNENKINKPFLQIDDECLINYGDPVYEFERAIGTKQFFPDKHLREYIIGYVKDSGGKDLFRSESWKQDLNKVYLDYIGRNRLEERYETEREYVNRLYYELKNSKVIIEKKLNKKVRFLCWPGGSVTKIALEIASDVGYISSTACRDIQDRQILRNRYGENPSRINRIGTVLFWNKIEGPQSKVIYENGFNLIVSLIKFENNGLIKFPAFLILGSQIVTYMLMNRLKGFSLFHVD